MDLSDATQYLLYRIQMLEPDLATKIIGCILIEDRGERDMIRLAYASDELLENLVHKTKLQLGFLSLSTPISPLLSDASVNYTPFDDYRFQNQADHLRGTRGFPVKTICHYFNKGFCKHGSSCRYHHATEEDHHVFSPDSLEKLEIEISELLKLTRGNHPVSIASLPMLYYDSYGKTLQAEGYLTESQRHGRAGYSLTKLLARLKGIRLIDRIGEAKSCYSAILRRPHGQHSVILAEDASKYNSLDNQSERNDPGPIVNGSRQIYLTFPADSTFTEEDVSNYFSSFGAVEDVRIPCQQKRMFGFVTFVNVNAAKTALVKGNPHFVCGSRVLAKPYREKSKLLDRKYMEKNDHPYYGGNHFDMEPDFSSRRCAPPRFLRRQLMEKEQALEMEMRRLSELRLACNFFHNRQYVDYSPEDLNPSQEELGYVVGVMNNNSGSDDTSTHSQWINLPESPFAPAIGGSGISTVL